MNKEELELVLSTVKELGDAGQHAFIFWLICDMLKAAFTPLAFIVLFFQAGKLGLHAMKSTFLSDELLELSRRPDDTIYDIQSTRRQGEIKKLISEHFSK